MSKIIASNTHPAVMKIASRSLFAVACVMGAASVLVAAFAAHKGGDLNPAALRSVQSAIQFHQIHALALLVVAWMAVGPRAAWPQLLSGLFFLCGMLMFSVNIELIHLAGVDWFRALTPYGGLAFVAGWLSLLGCCRTTD
jgi:uncharacterized membrane protein YgdD (TMEM256/DUF423 family)